MKYILILLTLVAFNGFGQSTGLYGQKTILEVQGHGSWPAFNNWSNSQTYYRSKGSGLIEGRNVFDGGVRAGVTRAFSNMVGLGIEYGLEYQSLAAQEFIELAYSDGTSGIGTFPIRHEAVSLNTMTIMPKFEFSSRGNLLPIGLSHQLGVGYSITRIMDKEYDYNVTYGIPDSLVNAPSVPSVNTEERYRGVTIMYQINMRTPITEQLIISYGFRYNMNFVNSMPTGVPPSGKLDMRYLVKEKRNGTFVQFHLGAAFAF